MRNSSICYIIARRAPLNVCAVWCTANIFFFGTAQSTHNKHIFIDDWHQCEKSRRIYAAPIFRLTHCIFYLELLMMAWPLSSDQGNWHMDVRCSYCILQMTGNSESYPNIEMKLIIDLHSCSMEPINGSFCLSSLLQCNGNGTINLLDAYDYPK